ncbi:MAG: hypothetical protein IT305_04940 [Chloroflexi bacterium]|nr:hypothetical protein [Chloroflexota bacterium]
MAGLGVLATTLGVLAAGRPVSLTALTPLRAGVQAVSASKARLKAI